MDLPYISTLASSKGGFNFENYERNALLVKSDEKYASLKSRFQKTGTSICGVVTADAVILAADTRATMGHIVMDKNCRKLHRLADNIWTAGAGTSADLDHTTALFESKMELERLATGRQCRMASVITQMVQLLFRYRGHIEAALVVGGVDCHGPQLVTLEPFGSSMLLPFTAMGSGSLNALAVLETGYRDNLSLEEGKVLVTSAIRAGVLNDLGSGGFIDLVILRKDVPAELLRGVDTTNFRLYRAPRPMTFAKGTTPMLSEQVKELQRFVVVDSEDVDMRG